MTSPELAYSCVHMNKFNRCKWGVKQSSLCVMTGALCYPTCIVALSDPVVLANGSTADTVEHWMLPSKVQVRCLKNILFDITGCFSTKLSIYMHFMNLNLLFIKADFKEIFKLLFSYVHTCYSLVKYKAPKYKARHIWSRKLLWSWTDLSLFTPCELHA